jgi:hypothetical protein
MDGFQQQNTENNMAPGISFDNYVSFVQNKKRDLVNEIIQQ